MTFLAARTDDRSTTAPATRSRATDRAARSRAAVVRTGAAVRARGPAGAASRVGGVRPLDRGVVPTGVPPDERGHPAAPGDDTGSAIMAAFRLQGRDPGAVAAFVRDHHTYRRAGGRADWIRRLRDLRPTMPGALAALEAIAVHVMTCG